jgi:hypothetical protein
MHCGKCQVAPVLPDPLVPLAVCSSDCGKGSILKMKAVFYLVTLVGILKPLALLLLDSTKQTGFI